MRSSGVILRVRAMEVAGHIFLIVFRGCCALYFGFTSVNTFVIRLGAVFGAVLLRWWRFTSVLRRFYVGLFRSMGGSIGVTAVVRSY